MSERATLTLLADGAVLIGFPERTSPDVARVVGEAIEKYVASDHADGVALSIPFPLEVDDQRFVRDEDEPEETPGIPRNPPDYEWDDKAARMVPVLPPP